MKPVTTLEEAATLSALACRLQEAVRALEDAHTEAGLTDAFPLAVTELAQALRGTCNLLTRAANALDTSGLDVRELTKLRRLGYLKRPQPVTTAERLVDLLDVRHRVGYEAQVKLMDLQDLFNRLGWLPAAALTERLHKAVSVLRGAATAVMPDEEIPGVEEEKKRRGL